MRPVFSDVPSIESKSGRCGPYRQASPHRPGTAPALAPSTAPEAAATAVEFHYTQTDTFVALLQQLGASLLVSTYQANKLLAVRAAGGGLSTLVRTFDRPMGLAADSRWLAVGTRTEVWLLRNAPDIAPRIEPAGHHDACYVPRSCHVTGDIGIHEMAWAGRLWLLESGTGRLVLVDAATGQRQTVAEMPGFTRGLTLCGPYVFIGLSKIRLTYAMDSVPLAERRKQLKCGIAAVDLRNGGVIAFLEFQAAVEEIFDVQLLPGLCFPEVIGFQQETIQHTFIVPPET